jgi:tripartite ATP-independent transporter DctM subunit
MKEKGYPAPFVAAVLSSSSTLAIIIPPSIPMILYGSITGTSIVQLFVGGVIPGVLIAGAIMVTSAILARAGGFAECEPFELRRVRRTFGSAFGALALPLIILGGIFSGAFTATEAAAVAVVAALVLGVLFYRRTRLRDLGPVVLEAAHQTGVVMILVAASAVLGWYLTNEQVPETLARVVTTHVNGRVATLFVMNGALLVAGMFLHSTAAIVLLVPIFMPLVKAIDMDPVHFGLVLTLNLAIGQQTPPVASVLITSCSIARARLGEVMRVNVYFILAMLLVLLLVTFVPEVVLWLPAQLTAK